MSIHRLFFSDRSSSIHTSEFSSVIVIVVSALMAVFWIVRGFFCGSWLWHGWLIFSRCFFFFLRCVLVVLLIYAAVDLVCLHLSEVFFFFFLCVCVSGGILPVEAGSCLQSGSHQSPDL